MSVITPSNPKTVPASAGYSQGMVVQGAARRLVLSGQIGVAPDGTVAETGEAQIAQCFANIRAMLDANGMGVANVVKITTFLTDRALLVPYRAARGAMFSDHHPASTLLFVAGLADPHYLVEIEAEAVA